MTAAEERFLQVILSAVDYPCAIVGKMKGDHDLSANPIGLPTPSIGRTAAAQVRYRLFSPLNDTIGRIMRETFMQMRQATPMLTESFLSKQAMDHRLSTLNRLEREMNLEMSGGRKI